STPSTSSPVSSRTSRLSASSVDSPRSTTPPGSVHLTRPWPCQSLPTSRTRPRASRSMAAATTNSRRATGPRQGAGLAAARGHAGEDPGLLLGLERRDQLVEVAGHDARQVLGREADAVVRDARLREVVRADALAALAAADLHQAGL